MRYFCPKCKRRFNWNTMAVYGNISPCCTVVMENEGNVTE